ncbi:DNA repair protein XRCC3 homolog [Chenopodium quinoa]|uniref:DNA repair protein XRCC3 homolog n=1 Tax=Chenopodium quinoa TaxID=63459 RepID=UPI000B771743|nr:DNA repair protein XRCC3 homolog [Chenopodium quinoa]
MVQVKKINRLEEISLVLNQVEVMIINSHEGCRHTRFVALNSIAYLFRHDRDNTSKGFMEQKKTLVAAVKKMKEITTSYNVAFVTMKVTDVFDTSDSVDGSAVQTFTSGREVKASLGMVWESLMPNKFFISKQYNNETDSWERDWMVVKCNDNSLIGRHYRYCITTAGLTDY